MNLKNLTILEARDILKKKEVSTLELVTEHLRRIEDLNSKIGAYLFVDNQGALKEAEKRDKSGDFELTLAGVPIAVKDVLVTKDMPTTAGSKILAGFISPYDATVITRLKQAGAILIGKTNMDEFAMGSSTENSAYFPTKNPWDLTRVPGGSGGGSAAAVAADLAVAAVGSDTGGSIRQPAAFTGTVGLKPTYGRVSRFGAIALASSLDQIGPVTKDVSDASVLLSVIAGQDEYDWTTTDNKVENYLLALSKLDLKKLRIGLPKEYFGSGIDHKISELVEKTARLLEKQGAYIQWVSLPTSELALSVYYVLMPSEASSNLARYDGIRYGPRHRAGSVLETYLKTRESGFGDEPKRRIILGTYSLSEGYKDGFYKKALVGQKEVRQDFEDAFKKVDLLISPTTPSVAFKFGEAETPLKMYMNDILTLPSNLAGNTSISIPVGIVDAMPVGLQIIGPQFSEAKVMQVAKKIEELANFNRNGEPSGIS